MPGGGMVYMAGTPQRFERTRAFWNERCFPSKRCIADERPCMGARLQGTQGIAVRDSSSLVCHSSHSSAASWSGHMRQSVPCISRAQPVPYQWLYTELVARHPNPGTPESEIMHTEQPQHNPKCQRIEFSRCQVALSASAFRVLGRCRALPP